MQAGNQDNVDPDGMSYEVGPPPANRAGLLMKIYIYVVVLKL